MTVGTRVRSVVDLPPFVSVGMVGTIAYLEGDEYVVSWDGHLVTQHPATDLALCENETCPTCGRSTP